MSANLNFTPAGNPAFAYSRAALERPWHGLGTRVDGYMTAAEALAASGCDYTVKSVPLYRKAHEDLDDTPVRVKIGARFAAGIMREDTGAVFCTVTDRYVPIQNREAAEVLQALIDGGEIKFTTMGALGEGEKFFAAGKVLSAGDECVVPGDVLEKNICVFNGHDASLSLTIKACHTLPVCSNTVGIALKEDGNAIRVLHLGNVQKRVDMAKSTLGIVRKKASAMQRAYHALAKVKMSDVEFASFVLKAFEQKDGELSPQALGKLQHVYWLRENGPGQHIEGRVGTAWGALNAVTAFTSHFAKLRGSNDRLSYTLLGSGAALNQRAEGLLMKQYNIQLAA